jgi:hypothetical protein
MTAAGWLFLVAGWGAVIGATAWCLKRVLSSRKHWTQPDEDIRELHHGEFGEEVPKGDGGGKK